MAAKGRRTAIVDPGETADDRTRDMIWFDEDHIVVDCEGRIIVQTRQLAMVPTQ